MAEHDVSGRLTERLTVEQFRAEVNDKLSVVFNGCNSTPLARMLHRQQCEDFLVDRYAEQDATITRLSDEMTQVKAENERLKAESTEVLACFDLSVSGVHLLDSPRPDYGAYDKAEWHTRGIKQGLKIARTILVENMELLKLL